MSDAVNRASLLTILATKSFRLGDFTLASGKKSDYYIDCRTTTLTGEGGRLTGLALLDLIRQHGLKARAVGGLTLGAPGACSRIESAEVSGSSSESLARDRVQTAFPSESCSTRPPGPPARRRLLGRFNFTVSTINLPAAASQRLPWQNCGIRLFAALPER